MASAIFRARLMASRLIGVHRDKLGTDDICKKYVPDAHVCACAPTTPLPLKAVPGIQVGLPATQHQSKTT